MIARRPGSWTAATPIAAWYTPISASRPAAKAAASSSLSPGHGSLRPVSVRTPVSLGQAGRGRPAQVGRGRPAQAGILSDPSATFESTCRTYWTLRRICVRIALRRSCRARRGPPDRTGPAQARRGEGKRLAWPIAPRPKEVAMNPGLSAPANRPRCRVAPSALALLESARRGLADAEGAPDPGGKYVAAHLAALRAAAAVVTTRAEPGRGRRRSAPRSGWELLPRVDPAPSEWAAFFAPAPATRAAAEAGLSRSVRAGGAEDLLRDAETFLSLTESVLGVPSSPLLPLRTAG